MLDTTEDGMDIKRGYTTRVLDKRCATAGYG